MKPLIVLNAIMIAVSFSTFSQVATSADGIHLAYEVHGDGAPALVLVHGWSCDRSYWKGQLEPFSRRFKVVAVDLAGHGESGLSRRAWTIEAFGADVAAVVEKLDLQRVILIGHSMGSDVIAEAALRLPGRVAGLVLVDQYNKLGPGRTPEQVQAFAARLRTNFVDSVQALVRRMFLRNSDSSLVERVAADMSSAPPAIALEAFASTLNYSRQIPRTLDELKLPVIAINSDNSPTDTASMKRYEVEVMIMPGVGHFLMMEDAKGFNRILETAIAKFAR
jgi:pimeloyl-ACP methyl ester carboxylesterase